MFTQLLRFITGRDDSPVITVITRGQSRHEVYSVAQNGDATLLKSFESQAEALQFRNKRAQDVEFDRVDRDAW